MKLMFISDIHGIKTNLDLIKERFKSLGCDKLIVLGDLFYAGQGSKDLSDYDSPYVMEFLKEYIGKMICMRGNCDAEIDIKCCDFPICSDISLIYVDGLELYLTHGHIYNRENRKKFNNEGILISGHEHIPEIVEEDGMIFINPGSISYPRDGGVATYMIYENKKFTIYDVTGKIVKEFDVLS